MPWKQAIESFPNLNQVEFEEGHLVDFENKSYARNSKDIKNRWRKQLKFSTLDIISLKLGDSIKVVDVNTRNESMTLNKIFNFVSNFFF